MLCHLLSFKKSRRDTHLAVTPQADGTFLVTGNTYPVHKELKALGGHWNPEEKGWNMPPAALEQALTLIHNARFIFGEEPVRENGQIDTDWLGREMFHGDPQDLEP